jgi:hypothetical protein
MTAHNNSQTKIDDDFAATKTYLTPLLNNPNHAIFKRIPERSRYLSTLLIKALKQANSMDEAIFLWINYPEVINARQQDVALLLKTLKDM